LATSTLNSIALLVENIEIFPKFFQKEEIFCVKENRENLLEESIL
jgi:hypothetical protein